MRKEADLVWEIFKNGTGQVSEFPLTYTIILKELDHPVHPQPQPRDWALDPS